MDYTLLNEMGAVAYNNMLWENKLNVVLWVVAGWTDVIDVNN